MRLAKQSFKHCFFFFKKKPSGGVLNNELGGGRGSGDFVEHHIYKKTEQTRGSVDFFYLWPKAGPLGKGHGVR